MKYDIANLISDFVREGDQDLQSRLESQAEALADLQCTDERLGRWVDSNPVEYLYAAFNLKDQDFAKEFPRLAHITSSERRLFLKRIDEHFCQCVRCSLKRGYDLELDSRIERACREHKGLLLQALKEDKPDAAKEGEHQNTLKALSAHQ